MSEREELEADTLNMSQGEQSEWMGTDPYRWAHACIQHAKALGPASGEDEDNAVLDFMAAWFASAMMAKADAILATGYTKDNGELVEAARAAKKFAEIIATGRDEGDNYRASEIFNICERALSDSEATDGGRDNG